MTRPRSLNSQMDLVRFGILLACLLGLMVVLELQLSDAHIGSRVSRETQADIERWSAELGRLEPQMGRTAGKGRLPVAVRIRLLDLMGATNVVSIDIHSSNGHKVWSLNGAPRSLPLSRRTASAIGKWQPFPSPAEVASVAPLLSVRMSVPAAGSGAYQVTLYFAPAVLAGALRSVTSTLGVIFFSFTVIALAAGVAYRAWRTRNAEARMATLSQLDRLTGIPHRTTFITRLDSLMTQGEALENGLAIMFIDLRRFSEINQRSGTEAADHVLRVVALRLKMAGKATGLIARLGGDHFAVIDEGLGAEDAATDRAARILELIRQPIDWPDGQLRMAANIGVALAPRDGRDRGTLMKHADLALQHAKALGTNQIAVFSPASGEHYQARRALERLVLDAVEDEGFTLHYQPIIDMRNGKIAGFEALLRLMAKDASQVSPADFVPLLEHLGKIENVGRWVIARACAFARHWPAGVKVAVNLSPLQFGSGNLPDDVATILAKTGCPVARLELEVTENLVLDRTRHVHDQLQRLQRMGIAIVLDDFGTGYSSLSYLCQFAFDKIKIDQEFIRGASNSSRARGILRTIAALARRFDLPVTAEGVETPAQVELVRTLKCQFAQGYLFSRPVPEADVASLILHDFTDASGQHIPPQPAQRPRLVVVGT